MQRIPDSNGSGQTLKLWALSDRKESSLCQKIYSVRNHYSDLPMHHNVAVELLEGVVIVESKRSGGFGTVWHLHYRSTNFDESTMICSEQQDEQFFLLKRSKGLKLKGVVRGLILRLVKGFPNLTPQRWLH